ncbi:MAG: hypothetical protein R3F59_28680 [Myxococcota bacterium]
MASPPPGDSLVQDVARLVLVADSARAWPQRHPPRRPAGGRGPGADTVQLLPADTTGTRARPGRREAARPRRRGAGMAVLAADTDGDGDAELLRRASGGPFPTVSHAPTASPTPTLRHGPAGGAAPSASSTRG